MRTELNTEGDVYNFTDLELILANSKGYLCLIGIFHGAISSVDDSVMKASLPIRLSTCTDQFTNGGCGTGIAVVMSL